LCIACPRCSVATSISNRECGTLAALGRAPLLPIWLLTLLLIIPFLATLLQVTVLLTLLLCMLLPVLPLLDCPRLMMHVVRSSILHCMLIWRLAIRQVVSCRLLRCQLLRWHQLDGFGGQVRDVALRVQLAEAGVHLPKRRQLPGSQLLQYRLLDAPGGRAPRGVGSAALPAVRQPGRRQAVVLTRPAGCYAGLGGVAGLLKLRIMPLLLLFASLLLFATVLVSFNSTMTAGNCFCCGGIGPPGWAVGAAHQEGQQLVPRGIVYEVV
jgi:hypothetical protein